METKWEYEGCITYDNGTIKVLVSRPIRRCFFFNDKEYQVRSFYSEASTKEEANKWVEENEEELKKEVPLLQ